MSLWRILSILMTVVIGLYENSPAAVHYKTVNILNLEIYATNPPSSERRRLRKSKKYSRVGFLKVSQLVFKKKMSVLTGVLNGTCMFTTKVNSIFVLRT